MRLDSKVHSEEADACGAAGRHDAQRIGVRRSPGASGTCPPEDRLTAVQIVFGEAVAAAPPMVAARRLSCSAGNARMFDIYLNRKNDLLVVPTGISVPSELSGNWRKKKRAIRSVSAKIRADVQLCGYHRRKLAGRAAGTISR
jgi:hypothetical protein